ncbi:MAG: hypothetical protein IT245_02720 [Bacteroidia bacterium]|nr:hypothetical protein [Bacteroidia bacterium]
MAEFLNFQEISKVPFLDVLNWLNIPFHQKNGELKGDGFVINLEKNLYVNPKNSLGKGSVINFYANTQGVDLRTAASMIKAQFLTKPKEPKREIPNLILAYDPWLHEHGFSEELCKKYEVGMVKQKSIFAGKICFKTYDEQDKHSGYVAYNHKDGSWLFPKNYRRTIYNIHNCKDVKFPILVTNPFDVLRFAKLDFPYTISLLGKTMTEDQENQLKQFRTILLLHVEPDNIVQRLSKFVFIKSPEFKPPEYLTQEDILKLIG